MQMRRKRKLVSKGTQDNYNSSGEEHHMMVAVLSSTGIKLMPTSCYRARHLLKSGKADIYQYRPFTIKLTQRSKGDTQPIEYCCDTGYQHIGISIKSEKHEYVGIQVNSLKDEKSKHQDCRTYRRTRRNYKTRYRKAKFDNRKASKPTGWLAPSIKHKKDIHLYWANRYIEVMPITDITFEMGEFDTQLLKAIEEGRSILSGKDYQQGERYGIETLRSAVLARDDYTCQSCGSRKGPFSIHHVVYRSEGGTNRMSNLVTVCTKCHTPANHRVGGKLWRLKETWHVPSFKGATFMTMVRWQMYEELKESFPNVSFHLTYGARTKEIRRLLNIAKSHINDAFSMGIFHPRHRTRHYLLSKKRRNNRVLAMFYDAKYIDCRDGFKKSGQQLFNGRTRRNHMLDTENLHVYRAKKISKGRMSVRRQHYPIQTGDVVIYKGKKHRSKGVQNLGTYLRLDNDKAVPIKQVEIYTYAGGYLYEKLYGSGNSSRHL